jgi:enediyne biosynthesis protein E4
MRKRKNLFHWWMLAQFVVAGAINVVTGSEPRPPSVTLQLLERRKAQQIAAARKTQVFHLFEFTNRIDASGIQFEHQIVEDAGKEYKAAHYDHGNGMAVADIDGDGKLDLYFTTQLGSNRLYRNLGGNRFEDVTALAGVGLTDRISVAASFADIDNDGLPDLFVTTVRHGNHLFRNLGGGRFEDITKPAGLDYSGHSSGAVFFDFDNDGLLDLFLVNVGVYTEERRGKGGYYVAKADAFYGHLYPERTEFSILYRNLGGGRFRDVSEAMQLRDGSWSGDATFTDLNRDGFPDLYVVNMQGDDHYYENQGGQRFVDKTAEYFPKTPWGAMGVKFFDFNLDQHLDLFVTDMHSDMTQPQTEQAMRLSLAVEKSKSEAFCSIQWTDEYLQGASNNIFGNAFYQNRGDGTFSEVSDPLGLETYWPWGISVGDLNADGFEDVFITAGMGYPFRYGINSVLLNDGGRRFVDSEFVLRVEPRSHGRLGKVWFTLDCSGADRTHRLCAGKSDLQTVMGSLSSRSSVLIDLDGDGDLDIVTNEFNDRPQLLVSNLSDVRPVRFLQIQLTGTQSNRDGLGAIVRVRADGRTLTRYCDGKSGYLSQSVLPLYFGLGDAERVDSVEVRWPSALTQVVSTNLPMNGVLRIVEAQKPPNEHH